MKGHSFFIIIEKFVLILMNTNFTFKMSKFQIHVKRPECIYIYIYLLLF